MEGAGTMEITAKEAGGLKRMDVKEANPYLRSMARFPAQPRFVITGSRTKPRHWRSPG